MDELIDHRKEGYYLGMYDMVAHFRFGDLILHRGKLNKT
jgi:hypothetical protein